MPDKWRRGGAGTACFKNCRSGCCEMRRERRFPTKGSSGLVVDPISAPVENSSAPLLPLRLYVKQVQLKVQLPLPLPLPFRSSSDPALT